MRQIDVDATLARLRVRIAETQEHQKNGRMREAGMAAVIAVEYVAMLDEHMSDGGTLPAQWRTKSPCHI